MNGDGKLDWVTSSFGGDWFLFTNDGDGTFTFSEEFPAPSAASCALMLDIDNDQDLDLALIDEIADVVILSKNSGTSILGDLDGDGWVEVLDLLLLLADWGECPDPCPPVCAGDLDGDCVVGVVDLLILLGAWG